MRAKRIKKLVDRIEALADSDDRKVEQAQKVEQMRRAAALDLHILCRSFVEELNQHPGQDPAPVRSSRIWRGDVPSRGPQSLPDQRSRAHPAGRIRKPARS